MFVAGEGVQPVEFALVDVGLHIEDARARPVFVQGAVPQRVQLYAVTAAVPELRHFARCAAQRRAIREKSSDTLSLVVSELAVNAVLHSGSADVTA